MSSPAPQIGSSGDKGPRIAIVRKTAAPEENEETQETQAQPDVHSRQDTVEPVPTTPNMAAVRRHVKFAATETAREIPPSKETTPPPRKDKSSALPSLQAQPGTLTQGGNTAGQGYEYDRRPIEEQVIALRAELAQYKEMVGEAELNIQSNGYRYNTTFQESVTYWNYVAFTHLEARLLVKRLGLHFPSPNSPVLYQGLKWPLFRLIACGEDTCDNVAMLLGPSFRVCAGESWFEWRLEALAMPVVPVGHPELTTRMQLNKDIPRWTPREATVAEQKWLDDYGVNAPTAFVQSCAEATRDGDQD